MFPQHPGQQECMLALLDLEVDLWHIIRKDELPLELQLPALLRYQNLVLVEVHVLRMQPVTVEWPLIEDLHRVKLVHYATVAPSEEVFIMPMLVN